MRQVATLLALVSSLSIVGLQGDASAEPLRLKHERLECVAELGKGVYQNGEPLLVGVRLWNRDNQSQYFPDCWSILIEYVIVTDQAGKALPYLGTRPEWVNDELKRDSIEWRPGGDRYAGQIEIGKAYGINRPGEYKIRVRYPLAADASSFAISAEVVVLVVPAGSIVAELRLPQTRTPASKDGAIPVRLAVRNRLDPTKVALTGISFSAAKVGSATFLWGFSADQRDVKRPSLTGEVTEFPYDLGSVRWTMSGSSVGPSQSIWVFASAGEKWSVSAELAGLYQGRTFKVSTNPVVIEIGSYPTALKTKPKRDTEPTNAPYSSSAADSKR